MSGTPLVPMWWLAGLLFVGSLVAILGACVVLWGITRHSPLALLPTLLTAVWSVIWLSSIGILAWAAGEPLLVAVIGVPGVGLIGLWISRALNPSKPSHTLT